MGVVETLGIGISVMATGGYGLAALNKGVTGFEASLRKANASSTQLGFSLKRLGSGSYNFAMNIVNTGESWARMAAKVEEGNRLIAKTTELPADQMQKMDKDLKSMVNTTSVELESLQNAAERAGSAGVGYQLNEIGKYADSLTKKFPFMAGVATAAFNASEKEIVGVTKVLAQLETAMGHGKLSDEEYQSILKVSELTGDKTKTATERMTQYADSLIAVGSASVASERDLNTIMSKMTALQVITGATQAQMFGLATGIFESGEQSRTSVNALTGAWTGLIQKADDAVKVFDELGYKSGDELRKALDPKNGKQALETLYKFTNLYAQKIKEGSKDAENFMLDLMQSPELKSAFDSAIKDRVFISMLSKADRIKQVTKIAEDSAGRVAKVSEDFQKTGLAMMTRLDESIKRVKESLGKEFMPILADFYNQILKIVKAGRDWIRAHDSINKFLHSHAAQLLIILAVGGKVANLLGDIVLVGTGLSRAIPLLANPTFLGAALAIAGIGYAAYLLYKNFDDFSASAKKFWKDIRKDAEITLKALKDLFTDIINIIKNKFTELMNSITSDPMMKSFMTVLSAASKGAFKIAIELVGAGAEKLDNALTGKNNNAASDNLQAGVINTGIELGQNKDVMHSMDYIESIYNAFDYALSAATPSWIKYFIQFGDVIYKAIVITINTAFLTATTFVVKLIGQALWAILDLGMHTIFGDAWNYSLLALKIVLIKKFEEDVADIKAVWEGVWGSIKSLGTWMAENMLGLIKWLDEQLGKLGLGILPHETLVGAHAGPKDEEVPNVITNPFDGAYSSGSTGGGQTGRIVRRPMRMKGFELGQGNPEAIVPLDRSSRTRGMRNEMSGKSGQSSIQIVKTEFKFHEKVLGEIIQHIQTGDIESNYGYVGTAGSGVG